MKKPSLSSAKAVDKFFAKIAGLSKAKRLLICALIVLLMVVPVVLKLYLPKHERIDELTRKYEQKKEELKKYKERAGQLNKLKAEIRELEDQFELARQALPEGRDIPELLTTITNAGQDAGLEFVLFEPQKEDQASFYAEIPISMEISGRYNETVAFFKTVSKLPRIVNIKDIRISPGEKKRKRRAKQANAPEEDVLMISCTAVTYKFVETPPEPKKSSATSRKSKKKRR